MSLVDASLQRGPGEAAGEAAHLRDPGGDTASSRPQGQGRNHRGIPLQAGTERLQDLEPTLVLPRRKQGKPRR